jgi:RNA-binding protein
MLIAECDPARLPRLYGAVVDSRMRPVGKVVDLFGSVQAPYVAIVSSSCCDVAVGEKVFW